MPEEEIKIIKQTFDKSNYGSKVFLRLNPTSNNIKEATELVKRLNKKNKRNDVVYFISPTKLAEQPKHNEFCVIRQTFLPFNYNSEIDSRLGSVHNATTYLKKLKTKNKNLSIVHFIVPIKLAQKG